jgi:hypothetical protein
VVARLFQLLVARKKHRVQSTLLATSVAIVVAVAVVVVAAVAAEAAAVAVVVVAAVVVAHLKVVRQLVIHQRRRNCLVVYLNFDCNLDLNLRTEGISS